MVLPVHDTNPTRRTPVVTYLLIAINVIVFLLSPLSSSVTGSTTVAQECRIDSYLSKYAAIPDEVVHNRAEPQKPVVLTDGEQRYSCPAVAPYTKQPYLSVLYAMFLHGGWLHLLGNMLFLYVFGNNVEDRLGRLKYLAFYLGCGYAATYGFSFLDAGSTQPLVGASGAIAGVLGAYCALEADPVDSAFDTLLAQAEQAEQPTAVRRTTRPTPQPDVAAEPPGGELVAFATGQPPAPSAKPETAAKKAATKRAPRVKTTAVPARPSGWSRAALEQIGVPEDVLRGLPAKEPADDLAWAAALAGAIALVLPAPAILSEVDPVVVDGHGVAGALGILRAATLGLTPGTITIGARTVPASAAELALVLRTAVVSG